MFIDCMHNVTPMFGLIYVGAPAGLRCDIELLDGGCRMWMLHFHTAAETFVFPRLHSFIVWNQCKIKLPLFNIYVKNVVLSFWDARLYIFCPFFKRYFVVSSAWLSSSAGGLKHVKKLFSAWNCGEFFQKETLYQNKVCIFSQKTQSSVCVQVGGGEWKRGHTNHDTFDLVFILTHRAQRLLWKRRSGEKDEELKELRSAPHAAHVDWRLQHSGQRVASWARAASSFYFLGGCAGAVTASALLWSQQYTHP